MREHRNLVRNTLQQRECVCASFVTAKCFILLTVCTRLLIFMFLYYFVVFFIVVVFTKHASRWNKCYTRLSFCLFQKLVFLPFVWCIYRLLWPLPSVNKASVIDLVIFYYQLILVVKVLLNLKKKHYLFYRFPHMHK